uniref:protein-L-isoaspartate(D-aspartate) O-methyltransferase n=1 Tax=Parascaris equorum TaxID=6256 RepID=A0A914RLV9_PAREQ
LQHASALERLKDHLQEGDTALDVGSGSGYLTVCMAQMVGETGKVVGIDHIKELIDLSKRNIEKNHAQLLTSGRVVMLVEQLAPGGRMLIPVGAAHSDQRFLQVDKDEHGEVSVRDLMGVIYVPLTSKENQIVVSN